MENRQELINIGNAMKNAGAKDNRFKKMIRNLNIISTNELCETIIETCLRYEIDCQEVINMYSEFNEGNISEEYCRRMLFMIIAN